MDSAIYAVIGAIGGAGVTQVANFVIEQRKIKNRREDERLARISAFNSEMRLKKQEAYAKFMAELDYWLTVNHSRSEHLLFSFYSAVILSSKKTATSLARLLREAEDPKIDGDELQKTKGRVIDELHAELTSLDESNT